MRLEDPHSRNLRLHRLSHAPATFFVTKCLQPKKPALNPDLRQIISNAFRFAVVERRVILRSFVVMPDHWHGLFGLLENWTLPGYMHSFMSFVGANTAANLLLQGCSWQPGYFDTRIRSMKQFIYVANYILENPVRKGLVQSAEDWDASNLKHPDIVRSGWPWRFEKD